MQMHWICAESRKKAARSCSVVAGSKFETVTDLYASSEVVMGGTNEGACAACTASNVSCRFWLPCHEPPRLAVHTDRRHANSGSDTECDAWCAPRGSQHVGHTACIGKDAACRSVESDAAWRERTWLLPPGRCGWLGAWSSSSMTMGAALLPAPTSAGTCTSP